MASDGKVWGYVPGSLCTDLACACQQLAGIGVTHASLALLDQPAVSLLRVPKAIAIGQA